MINILDVISEDFTLIRESSNRYTTKEHDSLKIFTDTNSWYWFSERVGGTPEFYIKLFWHYDEEQLNAYLAEHHNVTIQNNANEQLPVFYDEPYYKATLKPYNSYLANRNINIDTAKEFQLSVDEPNQTILMPISNMKGKVVGVSRRRYDEHIGKGQRYKIVLFEKHKPALWQMHRLKFINDNTKVLLFEGNFSCMRWWQVLHQQYDVVTFALLGANPNKDIPELLNGLSVIYVADYDETGYKVLQQLKCMMFKQFNSVIPTVAPDEMTDNQIINLFRFINNKMDK